MNKVPTISVIIPVYNVEKYIFKCVSSVLNQTFQDFEIILVDDGSLDLSGWYCDNYAKRDNRIHVIHKKNGGLSDARNVGIDAAQGNYYMFLDSDDWIDKDMLEVLYKLVIDEKADIAECSYRNIYNDHIEEETANTGQIITGDSLFAIQGELDWRYFKPVAWNKLYHKNIFADGKRYPVGKYHEDEFFTHKAFYSAKKLAYIDVSKYNYVREREGSITGNVTSKILDGCYALRERVTFAEENKLGKLIQNIQNMYCCVLFDRVFQCINVGVDDDKLQSLINDLKAEEQTVLGWDIDKHYKALYKALVISKDEFMECCRNPQNEQKYRELV